MKKYFAWIPAIGIAAAIFFFSSQPAEASTELSDGVTRILLAAADKMNLFHAAPGQLYELCVLLGTPVRKCAHITEFAVLHLSLLFALKQWNLEGSRWLKTAFFLTAAYAATDEFHQIFIPGRAGRITDVMIDCIGAAVITAVLWRRARK